ncbi:CGNR zinc finger domain-containing protein [Rhodococcus sp. NPDC059968]|uniref:CGNR zinc finger domain-containing protein n=1 Tax=Rhodococcus sp. NPDC059968 TaxID=3347017 RepID=UPI00366FF5B2
MSRDSKFQDKASPMLARPQATMLYLKTHPHPHPRGHTTSTGTPGNALSLLARDTIDLIGSPAMAKVKECSNPDCTRLFVDLSRGFSRRWCGIAECGNRIKAADYRRRKKLQGIE